MATVPARTAKSERLDVRLPLELKALIESAAALSGQTLSSFILSAASSRSRKVIRDAQVVELSERDGRRLLDALDAPPEPTAALKRAAARYKAGA